MFAGALRAEWIKLTTLRSHWVLPIVGVAFCWLVVFLTANAADPFQFIDGRELSELIVGVSIVTIMLLGVVSVLATTGEITYNTFRPTFAATANRWVELAAKLMVVTVTTLVITAVTVAVAWLGAAAILGDGRDVSLGDRGAQGQLVALVLLGALLTVLGMALAMLLRNSAAAIAILLLWPFVVESLIAGFLAVLDQEGLIKFLPYAAGFQLVDLFNESGESDLLSPIAGGIYFGCVVAGLWLLGALRTDRGDA